MRIFAMSAPDPLDFPPELCAKPAALVGLFGLNTSVNPVHRTIWEFFSKVHENSFVFFKQFDTSHNFPIVKPKKSTYDWYTPKGLLKRNWMKKHLLEIPAVAVLLFDLNWDDPNVEELRAECVAELQALRNSLGSHASKIAVILVQKTAPLPEDSKASERAKHFCLSCDIETKQLFVLPQGDHLQGYCARLVNALYDLAQHYYHHEIKQVKQHKDQLNKTTQQYLFVRHNFKLGFLSELKQDNHNAKKYYDLAYSLLKEVRMFDTNIVEVKLIAGFINFKICQLMFLLSYPRDAINQLRGHIDFYKNKTGPKELLFEHYSWLCKQYAAFGDIFNEAIRRGLPAVQTQHPGFYYRLAAHNASERKKISVELCRHATTYPVSDPLQGLHSLEFFGQRPWRPGKLSAEPTNPTMEADGIAALKYSENLVNHSEIIINLIKRAISQFKTYGCPRMRLQLVVQMTEEYYYAKDYPKALTLLSHIIWDYRNEKWWLILSTLLSRALSCAYLSASVQEYITFALEALGPFSSFDAENRKRIFNNLSAVLNRDTPQPEPDVPQGNAGAASKLWKSVNSSPPTPLTIEMYNLKSCIEAKARFTKSAYNIEETIIVEIFISCNCILPLEFSNISVIVNSQNYSSEFAVSSEKYCLTFEPGVMKKLHCEFKCDPSDANRSLYVGYVLLTLGSSKGRSVTLKYSITHSDEDYPVDKGNLYFQCFRINSPKTNSFDQIENLGVATIVPKESKVKVQINHDSPALLSEWYPIHVLIKNEENFLLSEASIEVKFASSSEDSIEQSTQLCSNTKTNPPTTKLIMPVADIPDSGSEDVVFHLRGHRSGIRNLIVKFCYVSKAEYQNDEMFVETLVKVPVIKPFDVSTEILSMKFEQIDKCFYRDPFILSPTVQILSPWPILIHHSCLELGLYVKSCDKVLDSHLAGVTLNEREVGTDMFALRIDESNDQPSALGTYVLKWSRVGSNELTSSSVTMPAVTCKPAIIGVEMSLPAHGWVRKPMTVEYRLSNNTSTLLELDLTMDASDAFMFAGQKQVIITIRQTGFVPESAGQVLLRLLPSSVKKLEYNLHPLFSGLVALPRLVLKSTSDEYSEQISQIIERNLPSHVYVMPQEKVGTVLAAS